MSTENFWNIYREIERALNYTIDDFLRDKTLIEETKKAIRSLYSLVMDKLHYKYHINNDVNKLLYLLLTQNTLSASTVQEALDVIRFIENIESYEPQILYSMIVRILEVLEELYFNA